MFTCRNSGNLELSRFDFGLERNVKRSDTSNCISSDAVSWDEEVEYKNLQAFSWLTPSNSHVV